MASMSFLVVLAHPGSECPSENKWIKVVWYIHTMESLLLGNKQQLNAEAGARDFWMLAEQAQCNRLLGYWEKKYKPV